MKGWMIIYLGGWLSGISSALILNQNYITGLVACLAACFVVMYGVRKGF